MNITKTSPSSLPQTTPPLPRSTDIRYAHTSAHIQEMLKHMNHTYISPITPFPSLSQSRIVTSIPYLTEEERNTLLQITNTDEYTQDKKQETIKKAQTLIHSIFPNINLHCQYTIPYKNTCVIQEKENTSIKLIVHPNYLYYIEYPTKISVSPHLSSGAYKHFFIQTHKGVKIPLLLSSQRTQQHQSRRKESHLLRSLQARTLPLLTQHLLKGREAGIPGSELIVIPDIIQSPEESNNQELVYIQSHYGKEQLHTRITREQRNETCTYESAKRRLRDIIIANQALFSMGLYNLDIKLMNSVVFDDGKNEHILQIDIDDMANKHFLTQEEKELLEEGHSKNIFSDRNEYHLLSHILENTTNHEEKQKLLTLLYQNKVFLTTFHYLLPYKETQKSLFFRLLCHKTFQTDKELIFITSYAPLSFLHKLRSIYMEHSSFKNTRMEHICRINMLSYKYMHLMKQTDQTFLSSMKIRLQLIAFFTNQDWDIILNRFYISLFLNVTPNKSDEEWIKDIDNIKTCIPYKKITDSPLDTKLEKI